MSGLRDYDWQSIYESRPSDDRSYLVEEFYVPALERSVEYDRVAGYFNSGSLAAAARGVEALVENDGRMRLIAGAQLEDSDKSVLEALAGDLSDELTPLADDDLDAQLTLLAWLLREDRLDIKIAVPKRGNWGVFHPKLGIFRDDDGDVLSFEGSVNETRSGWTLNYERFKVHRSWDDGQASYVDGDRETFDRLWNDEHDYVDVYPLPEAIEEELIQWKAPADVELEDALAKIRGPTEPTEADKADILAHGHEAPGGLHLAEEASTVTPWPHQRVVSDTAVNTYPNSFLFCDEVGLGKTIETGLTLSRLGLTGEMNTGLVLAPASLVVQWQEELWEKFNLSAYRYERGSDYEYAFIDALGVEHEVPSPDDIDLDASRRDEAWTSSPIWRFLHRRQNRNDGPTIVVMSWHTARLRDRWNQLAPADGGRVRTRDDTPASCRGRSPERREGVWDAVVIDEAHNGRRGSNLYSLLERLREHTHCYYLLTATPMQLHHRELYDLLSLVDLPEEWDDRDRFVEFFETRQALKEVLHEKGDQNRGPEIDLTNTSQATLDGVYQDDLGRNTTFADLVLDSLVHKLDLEDEGRGVVKQRLLTACNLACGYGRQYDDYIRKVDNAIRESDIDPFEAKEDKKLQYLLLPESVADERMLLFSRNDRLHALDELSKEGWEILSDVFSWATPVDAVIHRNTRDTLRKYEKVGLLDETVPERRPERRRIELNDETRPVYDRIENYTSKFYKKAQQSSETQNRAIGFVMTTYRQRLTSSIYAISRSLASRLDTLREQRKVIEQRKRIEEGTRSRQTALESLSELDEIDVAGLEDGGEGFLEVDLTELAPSLTDEGIELLEEEIEELESFIQEVKRVEDDPKMDRLFDDLQELDRQGHDRVIVFTQYKDTMHFIRSRLRWKFGENVACYSGDGGEMYDSDADTWRNVGKERVKREFADNDGDVDVLLCTDSASEGLNLQECGALINYDLPWNPMRVEQRIGRIDRIGQKYPEVRILNYSYEDTVESDIYDRLDDRIGLFEDVVGNMQPILSDVGSRIKAATLAGDAKSGTEESERVGREIETEIAERERQNDPVELKDSLADTDTTVREEVIKEARLDAWESYSHPDVHDVGLRDESSNGVYSAKSVRRVFLESETLAAGGITFTPVSELDIGIDLDCSAHSKNIYRLQVPRDKFETPPEPAEGTVAASIASGEGSIAVTFSPEYVDDYPSIHLLLPGDPIFDQVVKFYAEQSDEANFLIRNAYGYEGAGDGRIYSRDKPPWITCGWHIRDGSTAVLDEFGDITEIEGNLSTSIGTWCKKFVSNRDVSESNS